jgi:hypothetical protein
MDISLIKIESTKLCQNSMHYSYSTSVVASSQIMDYTPGREESVPIRCPFLNPEFKTRNPRPSISNPGAEPENSESNVYILYLGRPPALKT